MFKKFIKKSIRLKFLSVISIILFFSTVVLSTVIALTERETVRHSLMTKGQGLASYIAKLSVDPLITKDSIQLDAMINEANKDEDVIYTVIRDAQGNIVTSQFASINFRSPRLKAILSESGKESELQNIIAVIQKKESVIELSVPVVTGADTIGRVTICMSKQIISQQMIRTILFVIALNLIVALVLGAVLFAASKRIILTPIIEIADAAARLAKGDLSAQVKVETTGEVQMLVDSFNQMAQDLQKTTVSKEYVDNIFKSMIDTLIVSSPDGAIRTVNQAACELLGYREEELRGQPIKKIFADDTGRLFDELIRFGLVKNAEFVYVTKDNRKIPVLFSSSLIYSSDADPQGIVCVAVDITERKNAENMILRSQKTMQAILGSMPYGVVIIGKDKKIRDANEAALALMKYDSKEQIVGSTCNQTLCPAQEGKCPILDGQEKLDRSERILIAKDGKRVPILKTVVPVEIDNEEVLLEAFIDMTERKKADERLKNYSEELQQINEEMKNFAYIVSHDLRAPLVNIRGFSDELGRSIKEFSPLLEKHMGRFDGGEKQKIENLLKKDIPEALGFIGSSVTRMDSLINSILKLSRLGRNELKPEQIHTEDVVHTLLESLTHQIDMHHAEVTTGPLPDIIMDRTAAEQIFGNLIDNALKYLEPARPGKIELTAQQNGGEAIFTIRDNGRGIAKEDMHKVFELFRRVGRQDVPGEGMGLTYVKTLVRRLGGRIWCESEPGVGSAFKFTIPNNPKKNIGDADKDK